MKGNSFTDLINGREIIKLKYRSENERIKAKKEKQWQIKDYGKWEIIVEFNKVDKILLLRDKNYAFENMCTRETKNFENIHEQLGYANKMNMDELKKLINNNSIKFVENIKNFSEEFYPSLTDAINVWSCLSTYL